MNMHRIHFVPSASTLREQLPTFFPDETFWPQWLEHLHSYCRVHEVAHTELLSMLIQPLNWLDASASTRYWDTIQDFYAARTDCKKFKGVLLRFERGDPTFWGYGVRSLPMEVQTNKVLNFVRDRFSVDAITLVVGKFMKMDDASTQEWLHWAEWLVSHARRAVDSNTFEQEGWLSMVRSMPMKHQVGFVVCIYNTYHTRWKSSYLESPLVELIASLVKDWQRHDPNTLASTFKTMIDPLDDTFSSLRMPWPTNVQMDPQSWTISDRWVWKAFVVSTMLNSFSAEQWVAWKALDVSSMTSFFVPISDRSIETPEELQNAIAVVLSERNPSPAVLEKLQYAMGSQVWPLLDGVQQYATNPNARPMLESLFLNERCTVRWLTSIVQREVQALETRIKDSVFLQGVVFLRYIADPNDFSEPYNVAKLFVVLMRRLDPSSSLEQYKSMVSMVKQTGSADAVQGMLQNLLSSKRNGVEMNDFSGYF